MNTFQLKSFEANLKAFIEPLTLSEFIALTEWFTYDLAATPFVAPNELCLKFITEFFGDETFVRILSDVRGENKSFLKSSLSERDLFETIRSGLTQIAFFKLRRLHAEKPKGLILAKADKKNLNKILAEHGAMLRYQLEDEDFIRNSDSEGDELVEEKKRHLAFIEKLGIIK